MKYNIGDKLSIRSIEYMVEGFIKYKDQEGYIWEEYKIRDLKGVLHWLTWDNEAGFELSTPYDNNTNEIPSGYTLVESGWQECIEWAGQCDIQLGDKAEYWDYKNNEYTYSIEKWNDTIEYSLGEKIKNNDIKVLYKAQNTSPYSVNKNTNSKKTNSSSKSFGRIISKWLGVIIVAVILIPNLFSGIINTLNSGKTDVEKYLKSNTTTYEYITSITDNDNKSQVYKSTNSVEDTSKQIIESQNGEFEDVQSDTDGKTVALLSNNEYVIIYSASTENSADNNSYDNAAKQVKAGDTLIQVSSRKYTYSNTRRPFMCTVATHNYYKNFYHSFGYSTDSTKSWANNLHSPYTNEKTTNISKNSGDKYYQHASSIKESSKSSSSRSSSGGGTSSGK